MQRPGAIPISASYRPGGRPACLAQRPCQGDWWVTRLEKAAEATTMLINFAGNGHPKDEPQILSTHGPVKHSSWMNSHDFRLTRYRIWLVQHCRGCSGWSNQQVGQCPRAAGAQHCEHERVVYYKQIHVSDHKFLCQPASLESQDSWHIQVYCGQWVLS